MQKETYYLSKRGKQCKKILNVKKGRDTNDIEINSYVRRRKLATERCHKLDNKFEGIYKIISKGKNGSHLIEDLEGNIRPSIERILSNLRSLIPKNGPFQTKGICHVASHR
ncbi:hypothetical protein NGRA_2795 [Nosema granulosis]|uniref:Uncharacterized protein n=1 Tax=Nosema granulosis TaxID=83296 RepID=A0A9P6GXD9_9MICR|nr:hypothetical protein NGRA_2795 [Nosema granulosis]